MPEPIRTHISHYKTSSDDEKATYMPTPEEIEHHKRVFWERHLEDMRNSKSEHFEGGDYRRRVHRNKSKA